MKMLERKLGRKINWERDAEGRVQIPLEFAQNPDLGVDRYLIQLKLLLMLVADVVYVVVVLVVVTVSVVKVFVVDPLIYCSF